MVGCVIVHEGNIIGEGWHAQYGGPHAEVNAIASVENHECLPYSTLYVTLEPCSHYGKTPPCADLLLKHRIPRVVVANLDPNPLVAGRGIAKLREAGVQVVSGVMEEEGRWLNRRFFTFMEKKRPYILLKWAQTADGFIARPDFSSKWISNALARKLVHQWRSQEMGIMVGSNTAFYDNPQLNVRDWSGKDPLRILLDRQGKVPATHHLLSDGAPTRVYGRLQEAPPPQVTLVGLSEQTAAIPQIMSDLHAQGVLSVMVEGGLGLLQALIDEGCWDEARIFTGNTQFKEGIAAPVLRQAVWKSQQEVMGNMLQVYTRLQ
jgi:diaminohydroxyphosphoribosylaminopyrimidine deaminase/5-amino-6-(5-phosphoribosylamino)uracil reductase